jgi:hypothetical protein
VTIAALLATTASTVVPPTDAVFVIDGFAAAVASTTTSTVTVDDTGSRPISHVIGPAVPIPGVVQLPWVVDALRNCAR